MTNLLLIVFKKLWTDLLADDLCSNVILLSQTQPHLFQDEFHFFTSLHWTICFNLDDHKRANGMRFAVKFPFPWFSSLHYKGATDVMGIFKNLVSYSLTLPCLSFVTHLNLTQSWHPWYCCCCFWILPLLASFFLRKYSLCFPYNYLQAILNNTKK